MPAVSKKQQQLFALALSVKRGNRPRSDVSDEVLDIVDKMSEKDIKDFAQTSPKGLPDRIQKEERDYKAEYENYHSSDKQKRRRTERNAARRKMERLDKVKKGDGKDVHHRNRNTADNSAANLAATSKSKNRSINDMKLTKLRTIIKEEIKHIMESRNPDVRELLDDYKTWLVFDYKSGSTLPVPKKLESAMKKYGISEIEVNEYDHHYSIYAVGTGDKISYNKKAFDRDKEKNYIGKRGK